MSNILKSAGAPRSERNEKAGFAEKASRARAAKAVKAQTEQTKCLQVQMYKGDADRFKIACIKEGITLQEGMIRAIERLMGDLGDRQPLGNPGSKPQSKPKNRAAADE